MKEFNLRPLKIRGTHPYSFRTGEWATVIDTQIMTPLSSDAERPVYTCEYSDGFIDYIAISDREHYELG